MSVERPRGRCVPACCTALTQPRFRSTFNISVTPGGVCPPRHVCPPKAQTGGRTAQTTCVSPPPSARFVSPYEAAERPRRGCVPALKLCVPTLNLARHTTFCDSCRRVSPEQCVCPHENTGGRTAQTICVSPTAICRSSKACVPPTCPLRHDPRRKTPTVGFSVFRRTLPIR